MKKEVKNNDFANSVFQKYRKTIFFFAILIAIILVILTETNFLTEKSIDRFYWIIFPILLFLLFIFSSYKVYIKKEKKYFSALIFSVCLIPGLGELFSNQKKKGLILLTITIIVLIFFLYGYKASYDFKILLIPLVLLIGLFIYYLIVIIRLLSK